MPGATLLCMSVRLHYVLPDDEDVNVDILTLENTQSGLVPNVGDQVGLNFPDGSTQWRKVEARGHIQLEGVPHVMLCCRKLHANEGSF